MEERCAKAHLLLWRLRALRVPKVQPGVWGENALNPGFAIHPQRFRPWAAFPSHVL